MKRLGFMATPLIALILLSPPAVSAQEPSHTPASQVDCDSICLVFPEQAPAECACGITTGTSTGTSTATAAGGAGGGASPVVDPAAAAVVEAVREAYRQAVAGVNDYTVVQSQSVGGVPLGPPVVIYHEKQMVGGEPMLPQVPAEELARRQAEASGQPTPEQMATGLAQMLNKLGDAIPEDYTPTDAGEAMFIEGFEALAESPIVKEAAKELQDIADESGGPSKKDQEDLMARLMGMEELGARLQLDELLPCEAFMADETLGVKVGVVPGLQCMKLWSGYTPKNLAGIDLGPGLEGWALDFANVTFAGRLKNGVNPIHWRRGSGDPMSEQEMRAKLKDSFDVQPIPLHAKFELSNSKHQRMIIDYASGVSLADPEAEPSELVPNPETYSFIPRVTRSRILTYPETWGNPSTIETRIHRVLINQGLPTQEKAKRLVLEAMEEMGFTTNQ